MGTEQRSTERPSEREGMLVVGRIGAPHGLRGEVAVEIRTDEPTERFASGAVLGTDPPGPGPLTVDTSRWHAGRLLVRFVGRSDRYAVEALPGTVLVVNPADLPPSEGEDEFHDHELVELAVVTTTGEHTGVVVDVRHLPGQDLLAVHPPGGGEVWVPFVSAIVREVDRDEGRIVIDPPPGLMDME